MQLLDTPQENTQSFVDESNGAELSNMDSQSFTPGMQSHGVPPEASAPVPDEINLAELSDFNYKNLMELIQILDTPEEESLKDYEHNQ